ncbi:MAG: hypothetical protein WA735_19080 [Candidatus Acidiferrales bacterium]
MIDSDVPQAHGMNPEQQVAQDRLIEQYMRMIRGNGDASVFLIAVRNARQERIPPEDVADRVYGMLQTEDERKAFIGVTEAMLRGLDIAIKELEQVS